MKSLPLIQISKINPSKTYVLAEEVGDHLQEDKTRMFMGTGSEIIEKLLDVFDYGVWAAYERRFKRSDDHIKFLKYVEAENGYMRNFYEVYEVM